MTRRARVDGQLALSLDEDVSPQVEAVRALRRSTGLPESLTAPDVLTSVVAALRPRGGGSTCGAAPRAVA